MQHLDEGTIHAWLDGALSADEAARVDAHAHDCPTCGAAVAEARGLMAGASRILASLDDVEGQRPMVGAPTASTTLEQLRRRSSRQPIAGPRRSWMRTPVIAAAASIVLIVGSVVVIRETGVVDESVRSEMAADAENRSSPVVREAAIETTSVAGAAPRDAANPAAMPSAAKAPADGRRGEALSGRGASSVAPRPAAPAERRRVDAPPAVAERARTGAFAARAASVARDTTRAGDTAAGRDMAIAQKSAADADTARPSQPGATPSALERVVTTSAAAPSRAAAARARSERAIPPTSAEVPLQSLARTDTTYEARRRIDTVFRLRADTVVVARVETVTVIVPAPGPPALRDVREPARAAGPLFRLNGCYEIVQGGLPRFVTLDTTRIAGGAGETRFAARAPGVSGSWSPDGASGLQLVIAGSTVSARIEPSSGELRGTVRRGSTSESFVARRCR